MLLLFFRQLDLQKLKNFQSTCYMNNPDECTSNDPTGFLKFQCPHISSWLYFIFLSGGGGGGGGNAISNCPESGQMTFSIPEGRNFDSITWMEPSVSDNSGYILIAKSFNTPTVWLGVDESFTVVYTFQDGAGSRIGCEFTIHGIRGMWSVRFFFFKLATSMGIKISKWLNEIDQIVP